MNKNDHEKLMAALFGQRDVLKVKGHIGDPFREYVLLGPTLRKLRDLNNSPVSVYWWQAPHTVKCHDIVSLVLNDTLILQDFFLYKHIYMYIDISTCTYDVDL